MTKPQITTPTAILDPLSNRTPQADLDPLSSAMVAEIDPLSRALAAAINTGQRDSRPENVSSNETDTFEPWSSKKSLILNQYVTTKKISMTTAMNNTNDESIADASRSRANINDDHHEKRNSI